MSSGDLLESEVYKDAFCSHIGNVPCPGTIGIFISNQFIAHGENTPDGGREFKEIEVEVDTKTQFVITSGTGCPELPLEVVFGVILVT